MKLNIIATICISALAFYMISFGPGLFFAVKSEKYWSNRNQVVQMASGVLVVMYYPHIYSMALFEPYFNYSKWWIEVAGQKMNSDYSGFRSRVIK